VDAAVLCVRLGVTKMASARRTVETIGRDKFLGTIVVRDPPNGGPKKKGG
jgi:hypothetical protein